MEAALHSLSDTGLLCTRAPNGCEAGQDDSVDLRSGLRNVYEVYVYIHISERSADRIFGPGQSGGRGGGHGGAPPQGVVVTRRARVSSFSFFITLGLEMSDTKVYEP